jgi:diaminohydroxyphosphoribosylaminopyrimidine deaminase/5-amino-6-(5-phosphoribosylamino)uracil reductase
VDAHDIRFMQHAMALARKGVGLASPNPTVGCVIVREGEIVGEGFHQYDWRDHAEVVALRSAGARAQGATLYVTLEPCNHTGRTGPCTEAIIAAGIERVVAATQDPNPKTSGRGFERLQAAKIEVISGLAEEEARRLNESFARWIRTKRPFVTLKSALTLDGQLAFSKRPKGAQKWLTSEEARAEVQVLRHSSDALLTGIGTILADNPLLTDRSGLPRRRRLLRVVLDSRLRLAPQSRIVQTADDDLLVFTCAGLDSTKARNLQRAGVEIVPVRARRGHADLSAVLCELGKREILSVLLEAGPSLNGTAIEGGLADKLVLFYAPKIVGEGKVPFAHTRSLTRIWLHDMLTRQVGPDICVEGYPRGIQSE